MTRFVVVVLALGTVVAAGIAALYASIVAGVWLALHHHVRWTDVFGVFALGLTVVVLAKAVALMAEELRRPGVQR